MDSTRARPGSLRRGRVRGPSPFPGAKAQPDLVLTDISLTGRDGLELIKDLRALRPDLPVLVLSMHEESLYAGRALRAGARGYIMKRAGGDRVVEAIREVFQGRIAVSPEMTTHLLEEYAGRRSRSARVRAPQSHRPGVRDFATDRRGQDQPRDAQQLRLSQKTVETHRMNLMRKLKLKSANELLRFALQYVEKEATGDWEG